MSITPRLRYGLALLYFVCVFASAAEGFEKYRGLVRVRAGMTEEKVLKLGPPPAVRMTNEGTETWIWEWRPYPNTSDRAEIVFEDGKVIRGPGIAKETPPGSSSQFREFSVENVGRLRNGMNDKEVLALMGPPSRRVWSSDGTDQWEWWWKKSIFTKNLARISFRDGRVCQVPEWGLNMTRDEDRRFAEGKEVAQREEEAERREQERAERAERLEREVKRRELYVNSNPGLQPEMKQAILEEKIMIGMSSQDVEASWGAPRKTTTSSDGSETWSYPSFKLHFEFGKLVRWDRRN